MNVFFELSWWTKITPLQNQHRLDWTKHFRKILTHTRQKISNSWKLVDLRVIWQKVSANQNIKERVPLNQSY